MRPHDAIDIYAKLMRPHDALESVRGMIAMYVGAYRDHKITTQTIDLRSDTVTRPSSGKCAGKLGFHGN
jgi:cystathionine beta-lyase family protein involved in aluminum resistance